MILKTIIAFILFILTSSGGYAIWYIIRGKHKRDAASEASRRKEKKEKAKDHDVAAAGRWGIRKGSYCYPEINDVMGFDFVRVVKVDDELLGNKKDADRPKTFAESKGTGMQRIEVTTDNAVPERTGDDGYEIIPDEQPERTPVRQVEPEPVNTVEESISEQDLQGLDFIIRQGQWTNRDYDNPPDDQLAAIMDNGIQNDMIDDVPTDNEDEAEEITRTSEAFDAFLAAQMHMEEAESADNHSIAMEILNEIAGEGAGVIDESDIPDI